MALTALLQNVVNWLRAGYPHGVPEEDYVPLFALLARRLSLEEVDEVNAELVAESLVDHHLGEDEIRHAIATVTEQPALESDVQRVEAHLAAVGWVVEPVKE